MSEPTTMIQNSQEQVLSTDLNRIGGLAGKATQDALLALLGGIDAAIAPRDVVRRGLNLTPAAGMSVDLSPGEMMRFTAAVTPNQSQYKLGALLATQNLIIAPADPVNPRIDRISVIDTTVSTDSTVRNILQLPSRTVIPTAVNKTKNPSLTVTVTTGSPGVSPQPPATPANNVAIWDVYVPAAAVSISDNHLMDVRVRAQPIPYTGTHFVERGLGMSLGSTLTSIGVTSGRGFCRGGLIENNSNKDMTFAFIQEPGAPALAADQEWHCYVMSKGSGLPIGKNLSDGLIFVLSQIAPNAVGIPSSNINYNPLQGVGPTLSIPTNFALYLGTIHTDAAGNFESGGGGVLLNRDGTSMNRAVDAFSGRMPATAGFIKRPTLSWVDVSTVRVGVSQLVLNGAPLVWAGGNATWATDLAADGSPSDQASTWYYVYLRYRVTNTGKRGALRTVRPRISTEAPNEFGHKPTAEAGFGGFEYLYVGSFFNNASSDIRQFVRSGNQTLWIGQKDTIPGAAVSDTPTRDTKTIPNLPSTAKVAIVEVTAQMNLIGTAGDNASSTLYVYANTGTTDPIIEIPLFHDVPFTASASIMNESAQFLLPVNASKQFEITRTVPAAYGGRPLAATVSLTAPFFINGYIEDIESLNL